MTAEVRELIGNAARHLRESPRGKKALTPRQLRQMAEALARDPAPIARRDHAMILLCFAAGWRCSEILSLTFDDVRFDAEDRLWIALGASKTDQAGTEGREICLPRGAYASTCPVTVLRAWLDARGSWPGALFCGVTGRDGRHLRPEAIRRLAFSVRLKRLLTEIQENPAPYGTHSLRAGMITSAVENGADALLIMQRTGQKSLATVLRYVRPAQTARANPLAGLL